MLEALRALILVGLTFITHNYGEKKYRIIDKKIEIIISNFIQIFIHFFPIAWKRRLRNEKNKKILGLSKKC
jgi:hypothetical protein